MNEFFNPKSMVTPGVAGGLTMLIVNGVRLQFPELSGRYLALAISFLLGAVVVLQASRIKLPERLVYWVINSLVIFVMGFGTNSIGQGASAVSAAQAARRSLALLVPAAQAQVPAATPAPAVAKKEAASTADAKAAAPAKATVGAATGQAAELEALRRENAELRRQHAVLKKAAAEQKAARPESQPKQDASSFFKQW